MEDGMPCECPLKNRTRAYAFQQLTLLSQRNVDTPKKEMNNEPSLLSDPPGSNLPDKPLIVKCNSNLRPQKLTVVNFRSARNCTYDKFQEKIKKHIGSTGPFTIQWQDDKNDWYSIHDETSLFMAIDFYHSRDKGPTAPSGSLFMFRSSSRNPKITMLVEISADHDGLGLSKTLVASKEDHSPDGSQLSLSSLPGELSSSPLDDDAVTVSSNDTRGPKGKGRDDSSLLTWNGAPHSAGSSSSNKPPLKLSRSRSFTPGSRVSSTEEETPWGSARVRLNGRSSDSLVYTVKSYPDEPLAVLERLRLDQSILETERGKAWLQNQNTPQKAMLGVVPSQSNDSFPLNTEPPFSEYQKDERGKSDHNFSSFGSSESTDDLEDEAVNEVQPSKLQIQEAAPLLDFADSDNATHHLLVPEEVTDCSECGDVLDQIKYICATCGEKTPMSRTALAAAVGKGKSRASARVGYELCVMCFENVGLDHTLPTTPQELARAHRSAPEQKREPQHAFLFQMWGFNGWKDVEQDEMLDHCSGCQSLLVLSGTWYKCATCDNFTICVACYGEVHYIHPLHPFLVKSPPGSNSRSEQSNDAEMVDNTDEPFKHPGVQCFNCRQDIVGARFHCVNCLTININICSNCEMAGLPGNLDASDGGHNSSHIMLKIPTPLSMHEVQQFWRAYGHSQGLGHADSESRGVSPLVRSSPGSASAGTGLRSNEGGTEIRQGYVHLEICDSCNKPIAGVRYQCLNCPSKPKSFNLCSDCEIKSYQVHNPFHTFLKIPRPVDSPGPLEWESPLIPILYRAPAGPIQGTSAADISGDPAAYLRDLVHTFAYCDRHVKPIVGKWYRCAFCAKDLCADCEVLDAHDNTHIFLVLKAPTDIRAFERFADLENFGSSPPMLRAGIYHPQHD